MIDYADIVCGLAWGDEGKGKVTSHLISSGGYDYVCRWAGGSNAGHTIWVAGKEYKTHIVPAGIFHGVRSVIGPGCVLNVESFYRELQYLREAGFDTSLVKVSPRTHIVTRDHKYKDTRQYSQKLGTTSSGIGPTYSDKANRVGIRASDVLDADILWNENFESNRTTGARILCEGAQGVWLDIDWGNYPYVTSSNTLPYAAASLGFPPQKIRNIWGCAKAYDTRSGIDPEFPDSLSEDSDLEFLQQEGKEFGVTTGRKRKVNWLDINRLRRAINMTGTTHLVISKCDILEKSPVKKIRCLDQCPGWDNASEFAILESIEEFQFLVDLILTDSCPMLRDVYFSNNPVSI